MMPPDLERVQYYNRHSHDEYVYWLLDRCNEQLVHYEKKVPLQTMMLFIGTRESVDEMVMKRLERMVLGEPIIPLDAEKIDDFKPKPEPIPEPEVVEEKPTWVEAAEEVIEAADEEMIVPASDALFVEQDYNSWTVRELQDECKERGLTVRGSKAEVVLRLRRDDDGIQIVEQETEDETEAPSEEAAEVELDAPSEESEAVTEEVTDNDNSGQQGEDSSEEE